MDEFEVVKEVQVSSSQSQSWQVFKLTRQEYFADYLAQYPSHFSLTPAALEEGGEGPPNVSYSLPLLKATDS